MAMQRNNTNFALKLTEFLRNVKISNEYEFLKYYQNISREYFINSRVDSRGLLLYYTMGIGKSITAVAIAMDMMDKYKVIVLLSKSLQENMTNAIKQYVTLRTKYEPDYALGRLSERDLDNFIARKFSFVSLNASNMVKQMALATQDSINKEALKTLDEKLEQLNKENLEGKFIIIDEAHNLFRSIRNGSKNASIFYNAATKTKNLRLLFLSGTPFGDPYDAAVCFNMLSHAPAAGLTLFPESYEDYFNYFVDPITKMIINKSVFQNRIFGLVSHISATSKIVNNSIEFPVELPRKLEFVEMTADQYSYYLIARNKEARELSFASKGGPSMSKPRAEFSSTYRVRSRQISNYMIPYNNNKLLGATSAQEKIPDRFVRSPKLDRLMENFKKHKGRTGYVYSQFVGYSGLEIIKRRLELHGFEELHIEKKDLHLSGITVEAEPVEEVEREPEEVTGGAGATDVVDVGVYDPYKDPYFSDVYEKFGTGLKFAVIKGGVDTKVRDRYQDIFNDYENRYGVNLALLLISSTGAEGLDLKNVGHEHIFEVYWDETRIDQVVHRGIRNDSHVKMHEDEKKVQTYIYISLAPKAEWNDTTKLIVSGKYDIMKVETTLPFEKLTKAQMETANNTFKELLTTDLYLYITARKYAIGLKTFLVATQEVSIECYLNGEENCRVCVPDNNILFHPSVEEDIKHADPCRAYVPKKANVKEIVYDGVKYYYNNNEDSIYGYNIYKMDEKYGVYRKIPESDPIFKEISAQLDNLEDEK